MIDNPAISVVFTSYNHREYLRQALDALLNQTFKGFELIIVDDCSTDGSQEILKEYARKDTRIDLHLNSSNHGNYTYTTNQGASYAKCDYIIFSQCDDFANPEQLRRLYDVALRNPDLSLIYSASNMVDGNGNKIGTDYTERSKEFQKRCKNDCRIKAIDFQKYISESCIIPNLSALMMKRDLFEQLGGLDTDFLVLSDWDFYSRASIYTDVFYIREELNNFRQHSTTIRNSVSIYTQVKELAIVKKNMAKNLHKQITIKDLIYICVFWDSFALLGLDKWAQSYLPILKKLRGIDKIFSLAGLISLLLLPCVFIKSLYTKFIK